MPFLDTPPRILLVDDDPAVCASIAATLQMRLRQAPPPTSVGELSPSARHILTFQSPEARPIASIVTTATSLRQALDLIDSQPADTLLWDIIITDMHLGSDSGLDLLREVRGRGLPVGLILITGSSHPEDFIDAIRCGIDDMLLKPATYEALRKSVSRTYARLEENRSQLSHIHRSTGELDTMRSQLAITSEHSTRIENTVVEALLDALEIREPGSYLHSLRVQAYTVYFAHAVGYPESLLPHLERAALLHDVGKIGLADHLIFTADTLSTSQLQLTQSHTLLGEQVLSRIPFLRPSALIVRHHHEQFNGAGYPDGLSGDQIPLGARIFAIMDALNSMTTDHSHRPAYTFHHASIEIQCCANSQFDPHLIDQFERIPLSTWADLRLKVDQRRLTRTTNPKGAIPQLLTRP